MRGDSDRVNQICDSVGGKKFRLFQGGNCGGTSRVLNLETGNFQTLMRFQMRTPMHTELRAGCFGSGNIPDKFVAINQRDGVSSSVSFIGVASRKKKKIYFLFSPTPDSLNHA